jgi:hypothetical protein
MAEENKRQKVDKDQYQNKSTWNQRGATIDIQNSTGREGLTLSQYSGSNIKINNDVTSELAVNNKQVKVNNDSFETVKNNKSIFAGKDVVIRAGENFYNLKGFNDNDEVEAAKEWKRAYQPIANKNAQFETLRGGMSYPGNIPTPQDGVRSPNPTENQEQYVTDSKYPKVAYGLISSIIPPMRRRIIDEVELYTRVKPQFTEDCYKVKNPSQEDIDSAAGSGGYASNEKGAMQYPGENASTERGVWAPNPAHAELKQDLIDIQEQLEPIEKRMGNGGDEEEFVYRDKVEVIGAAFNDYPSIRVDKEGRTVPNRVLVGKETPLVNTDSVPHVEEVDNNSNFPTGSYDLTVGNRYNVKVGSGGVQIKTTGGIELGGTTFKVASNKTNIQSADGVNISSESIVEIQSKNNISLRSNKQIYIEPGLGVKNNTIVGGSSFIEGEIYANHITAPAEIQQTEQVHLFGAPVPGMPIGVTSAGQTVFGVPTPNSIQTYPHSHHFKNLPLRLTESNNDVKQIAQAEGINVNGYQGSSQCVAHEYKQPIKFESEPGETMMPATTARDARPAAPIETNVPPRCLFVPEGTRLVNDRRRIQPDGELKETFPELPKEGTLPDENQLTPEQILELVDSVLRARQSSSFETGEESSSPATAATATATAEQGAAPAASSGTSY